MAQGVSELTPRGRQWLELVGDWKRSGLTLHEFCARRGLKPATLSWWRQEMRRRGAELPQSAGVKLVEITRNGAATDQGFEIELASGVRLRVPMRFDAVALKQLLGVLGAC